LKGHKLKTKIKLRRLIIALDGDSMEEQGHINMVELEASGLTMR
jgi:hypothetical protein